MAKYESKEIATTRRLGEDAQSSRETKWASRGAESPPFQISDGFGIRRGMWANLERLDKEGGVRKRIKVLRSGVGKIDPEWLIARRPARSLRGPSPELGVSPRDVWVVWGALKSEKKNDPAGCGRVARSGEFPRPAGGAI